MFLFALIAFMNAWFKGDFTLARWMVNNQTAEYVGAPQKRFV